jgi:hypothetical protein|tara:strand:+ start:333 stop:494 length:162 start_codon:yes stop_codon:yes gene_type:complete
MDTEKWKSILVPRETYEDVVEIAKMEGRTISGQLRIIFQEWRDDRIEEARKLD